jgi:uncharacterized protein with PIN domain
MATARFRFHGELAEFLARERRSAAFPYACARAATVKHAIEALGVPHTEAGRLTVNGETATLSRIVREGDVIEVFPYCTVDAFPGKTAAFIADAHLGGLARLLRMLGFDTLFENAYTDRQILDISSAERRIVLTRDLELLKCREVLRGGFVHARKPEAQLQEVVARYGLARDARPFSLCLHCNLPLERAEGSAIADRVPEAIRERYLDFTRCMRCGRVYWRGSHWTRMRAMLESILSASPQA